MRTRLSFLIMMLVSGCSFSRPDYVTLQFSLQGSDQKENRSSFLPFIMGPKSRFPQSVDEFSCLALNVSGPGILAATLPEALATKLMKSNQSTSCPYMGTSSHLMKLDQNSMSLDVLAGPSRTIQVIGVSSSVACADKNLTDFLTSVASDTQKSDMLIAELGRTKVDLYASQSVTLQNKYNKNNPISPFICNADGTNSSISTSDIVTSPIPVSIVKDGLVLYLDAARAQMGSPPVSGCNPSFWSNLVTGGSIHSGALINFTTCGTSSGWSGTGTQVDPYTMNFDAGTNSVTVPNYPELEPSSQLAVEVWIKAPLLATASQFIVGKQANPNVASYAFFAHGSSGLAFQIQTTQATWFSSPFIPIGSIWDNQWHHVIGTFDGNYVKIYLDGFQVGAATQLASSANLLYTSDNLYIGGPHLGTTVSLFPWSLAQLAIYNRALSPVEVSQNCKVLQARFPNAICQ